MEDMSLEEEWMASIVSKRTKEGYKRGWNAFKKFLGKTPEEILELRRKEGKRFKTRIVMFYKHLIDDEGRTQNTARTMVIPVQSFLSYYDVPLKVSDKLPKLHMKLETYKPSVADLQQLYRLGDLTTKAWLSLSRDCPARIGDLRRVASKVLESPEKEFLIKTEKENVVGKVYISEETRELFDRNLKFPTSSRGIDKLLQRACEVAGLPKISQHLLRKLWITQAINLGIQDTIVRILSFKVVPEATLTYFLDREELRESWRRVIDNLPLEAKKVNGRLDTVMKAVDLILQVQRKMCLKELQKEGYATGVLGVKVDYSRLSHKEILEEYLKKVK